MTARVCPYPGLRPFTEEESRFQTAKKSATHKYRFYALPLVAERQLFSSFPFTVKSYNKIQHDVKEQNLEEISYAKNNSTYLQHCPFCQ